MRLNVAILFLNKKFEELLKAAQVSPPVVSVQEYLARPREYRQSAVRKTLSLTASVITMETDVPPNF